MRILYAIQGTGNGHLSRAMVFVPALMARPEVELDVLMSGCQADLDPPFPIRYQLNGMGFVFGKRGGIDLMESFRRSAPAGFLREVRALPVTDYDLVVNDFEPVSAWAARRAGIPCLSLSHQYAVWHPAAPRPKRRYALATAILRWYAPCSSGIGFHFQPYAPELRYPVIREDIRGVEITNRGHYTVYLPAYSGKRILSVLRACPDYRFEVFEKGRLRAERRGNVWLRPVSQADFTTSMAAAAGVLCGAGFETPSEALHLGKKLLVVPMHNQFEQDANAAALAALGVTVVRRFGREIIPTVQDWLEHGTAVHLPSPDETAAVVDEILLPFRSLAPAGQRTPTPQVG